MERRAFLIVTLIVAGMLISLFASGCVLPVTTPAVEEKVTEAPASAEAEATEVPAPLEEPVELGIWALPWTEDDVGNIWEPLIAKFEAANPDIRVSVELIPAAERREKMMTAYAAGETPDVAYLNLDMVDTFGRRNMLLPLDEYLSPDIINDFTESMMESVKFNDKVVMLPILGAPWGSVYNKALMREIGWDPEKPPQTWDDMREFCRLAVENGKYGWGISPNGVDPFILTWQAGGQTLAPDGSKATINSPEGLEALNFILELNEMGCFPPDSATYFDQNNPFAGSDQYFANDEQIITYGGDMNMIKLWQEQKPGIELGAFMGMENKEFASYGSAGSFGAFANTEHPEEAARFVLWITSPENSVEYVTKAGFPPVRKSALEIYTDQVDQVTADFAAGLQTIDTSVDTNLYFIDQYTIFKEELQAAMLGTKTPEQALADMEKRVNEVIAESPVAE